MIIGPNMTTLTYQMSRTLGRGFSPGDEIIVTRMDHEGNVSPWLQLAEDRGLTVRFLPFDTTAAGRSRRPISEAARPAHAAGRAQLRQQPDRLDQPGEAAGRSWRSEAGALTYVDAVQFAPHGLVDVDDLGCDFLACSAYKFFGPHMGICGDGAT